ncbi:MAG: hypothetical protein JWQ49_6002 [Edaphobacter sp.]|nr:hypothetical protein [Edaphobacter sp.]
MLEGRLDDRCTRRVAISFAAHRAHRHLRTVDHFVHLLFGNYWALNPLTRNTQRPHLGM